MPPNLLRRPAFFWIATGGVVMLLAAAASFVHQLREVQLQAEHNFSSRTALVQKFVTLNLDKLEVMSLLLRQHYHAPPAPGATALPATQPHGALWEIQLPLVLPGTDEGDAQRTAVVTGPMPQQPSPQQQREILAAAAMAPQIRSAFKYDPDVFRLYYLSAQKFLYLASRSGDEHVHFSEALYQRRYWSAAGPGNNPARRTVLHGPYPDAGGLGMVVTFAQPVHDGDRFLGIVALDLGVDKLQRLTTVGRSAGSSLLIDASEGLVTSAADMTPGQPVRAPLPDGTLRWQKDSDGTRWLHSQVAKDDLSLVHRLPRNTLYAAAAARSVDTWIILLLSGGLFVLALRLRRAVSEVQRLTQIDPLTQVLNRRGLQQQSRALLALARRKRLAVALAIYDIDHFKKINDTYGHPIGDEVLKQLGKNLQAGLRKSDLFCRWGGEEFVLLMVLDVPENASVVAERMRQIAQQARIPTDGSGITLSAGVVVLADGESIDAAVTRADQHLYAAKAAGRNRIVFGGAN